jgi:predicted glycosyltransferase involved in capsule biosynthesis
VVIRWCPGSSSTATSAQSSNTTTIRPVAPYYDERFHGYGKNKIEFIAHLRLAFYQFAILPRGFIVHNPHVESKSKQAWNNVSSSISSAGVANNLHVDMDRLYPVFLKELIQKYHHKPNINKNTTNRHHPEHIVDSCQ